MLEALRLHTFTHLRFFARSRLILGLAVVVGVLWSLGFVAFVLMESSGDRFDMLRTIAGQLRSFAWFYTAAMGLSVLTGLAAVLHPVLAVLIVLLFTDTNFYYLDAMLLGYFKGGAASTWITGLEYAIRGVYAVLPMLDPFAGQTQQIEGSLRVSGSDWMYLAATAGYAATVFVFWFLFADYRLRRSILN